MKGKEYPPSISRKLKRAGWEPGRHVNLTPIISELRSHGAKVNKTSELILSEFYGLSWNLPKGGLSFLEFKNEGTLRFFHPEHVPLIEKQVGEQVGPIANGGGFIVFATTSGGIVFLQDEWLCLLKSKDWPTALEFIFEAKEDAYQSIELTDRPAEFRSP